MSTPRVLHVETGRHVYGGARQVLYLQQYLPALGIENLLACAAGSDVEAHARAQGAAVHPLPCFGDLDATLLVRLARLARRWGADVLHAHGRRGADLWTGPAGRLTGRSTVLTRRVDNPEPRIWAKLKYGTYDHLIAISEGVRAAMVADGVASDRIALVHSSIDPTLVQDPAPRAELCAEFGLASEAPIVGIAAQLIPRKGHVLLFEALQRLAPRHPDVQVVVFGRGPLAAALPADAEARGLSGRVRFAGFRDDFTRWLGALDLLAHPALTEGLGNVLLQAAAAGVPSIATRAGGMPEAVADGVTGLLVPPGDVDALAGALDRLLVDDALRGRLGAAGPGFIEDGFTPEHLARGHAEIYRGILDGRAGTP